MESDGVCIGFDDGAEERERDAARVIFPLYTKSHNVFSRDERGVTQGTPLVISPYEGSAKMVAYR